MAPLIKNSFYLLATCLLFIPATAYINRVDVLVCEAVCGDWSCLLSASCHLLLIGHVHRAEYTRAHVHVFLSVCLQVFPWPNFHIV